MNPPLLVTAASGVILPGDKWFGGCAAPDARQGHFANLQNVPQVFPTVVYTFSISEGPRRRTALVKNEFYMIQKHITILFSLFFGLIVTCKGQKIQVIRLVQGVSPTEKIEVFDLIEKEVDTTRIQYIATLRSVGADKNATIQELYYALKRKSNFFGANGFRILEYNASKGTLLADVYYLTDTLFKENLSYHEKNFIYIFCREKVIIAKTNCTNL